MNTVEHNAGPLIDFLRSHREHIYKDANRSDVCIIPKEIVTGIRELVAPCNEEHFRSLVQVACRNVMNLEPEDTIVHARGSVVVKMRSAKKQRACCQNALPPEQAELMRGLFPGEREEEIGGIIQRAVEGIDFSTISNESFEERHMAMIQETVAAELSQRMEGNQVPDGLISHILRENCLLIHRKLALMLIEMILEGNKGAEAFLGYYGGEIRTYGGRKYKLPEIIDTKGILWNIRTIRLTAGRRRLDRNEAEKIESARGRIDAFLDGVDGEIAERETKVTVLKEQKQVVQEQLDTVSRSLALKRKELLTLRKMADSKPSGSDEEEIKKDIGRLQEQEHSLMEKRTDSDRLVTEAENLLSEIREKKASYGDLRKKTLQKIEELHFKHRETTERYSSLVNALAKALGKRKKPL